MASAPLPADEPARLAALAGSCLLDTPAEPAFDAITELASECCAAPVALISLVDRNRQWFKSAQGLPGVCETPREYAFCAHAILEPDSLTEVPDARLDPRFCDNPLVTGPPHIRFYAGQPLRDGRGHALGTLCVIDRSAAA